MSFFMFVQIQWDNGGYTLRYIGEGTPKPERISTSIHKLYKTIRLWPNMKLVLHHYIIPNHPPPNPPIPTTTPQPTPRIREYSDGRFYIKIPSHKHRNSHYNGKTVSWLSYLYNGNPHAWKDSLYWEQSIQKSLTPCTISMGSDVTKAAAGGRSMVEKIITADVRQKKYGVRNFIFDTVQSFHVLILSC